MVQLFTLGQSGQNLHLTKAASASHRSYLYLGTETVPETRGRECDREREKTREEERVILGERKREGERESCWERERNRRDYSERDNEVQLLS